MSQSVLLALAMVCFLASSAMASQLTLPMALNWLRKRSIDALKLYEKKPPNDTLPAASSPLDAAVSKMAVGFSGKNNCRQLLMSQTGPVLRVLAISGMV